MDDVTLTVADLAMVFGPMLAALFAMMRYQHVDSTKTRELIADSSRENREHAEKLSKENREHAEKLSKENREAIDKNRELIADLSERVSRIEGFLRLWPSPPSPPEDEDAEAA